MSEKNTTEDNLEEEVMDLYRPKDEYLSSNDCVKGKYYWGGGRSIGAIVICRGRDEHGRNQFEGLRNKFGVDYLFTEFHYDDDSIFGTYTPVLELGDIPNLESEDDTMNWLLDQELDLLTTRLEWLARFPDKYKQTGIYEWLVEWDGEHLETLQQLKNNGFSDTPYLTFKQIMESRRTESNVASSGVE